MGIRKRLTGSLLATTAATALVIGVGAAAAYAVDITFSISPGGAITAAAGKTTLKDTTTAQTLSCTSSSSSATLKSGHGISGGNLGSITALSFNNCTGPAGLTFTVSDSGFPWTLSGASFSSTTGVTTGHISGIHAHLAGPGCTADVAGTTATTGGKVKVTYTNKTHVLRVFPSGGTLHIWNVSGCFGLINTGDASQFTGSYTVSPAQTITSP